MKTLSIRRVQEILNKAAASRILVAGDVMLDQFIWGRVGRISPEAPVPVVEFERESFMPGGAANVARNLTSLGLPASLAGIAGRDSAAKTLLKLLEAEKVNCDALALASQRATSVKTRIIAHQQQVVRVDREERGEASPSLTAKLLQQIEKNLDGCAGVIVGDYGKGVVTQELLDRIKKLCRARGIWLSLDPKPTHTLDLSDLSLITPNRKEAFDLAGMVDAIRTSNPLTNEPLLKAGELLLNRLRPALLLVTLGEQGMLLFHRGEKPFHIPTMAREVFDVSGAGDTVIASFTLAIAGGASPVEAAIISNHAAGVVVGKMGTAAVTKEELLASFSR